MRPERNEAAKGDLYLEAKRAINKHVWRHHDQAYIEGTLEDRVHQHADLHYHMKRLGRPLSHAHDNSDENETPEEIALRCLQEGEAQHGSTDTTKDSRPA